MGDNMSRPIYDRLAKMSKKKLDKLEYDHQQHLVRFMTAKEGKAEEIQSMEKKYSRLKEEIKVSVPRVLGTAMEMRQIKAELLISRSILALLRSNQFHHRFMVMLIQDTKAGVQYDPDKAKNLIPLEFSELISGSIVSTNMDGVLSELKSEIDSSIGGE
jgi:hypothetical protein